MTAGSIPVIGRDSLRQAGCLQSSVNASTSSVIAVTVITGPGMPDTDLISNTGLGSSRHYQYISIPAYWIIPHIGHWLVSHFWIARLIFRVNTDYRQWRLILPLVVIVTANTAWVATLAIIYVNNTVTGELITSLSIFINNRLGFTSIYHAWMPMPRHHCHASSSCRRLALAEYHVIITYYYQSLDIIIGHHFIIDDYMPMPISSSSRQSSFELVGDLSRSVSISWRSRPAIYVNNDAWYRQYRLIDYAIAYHQCHASLPTMTRQYLPHFNTITGWRPLSTIPSESLNTALRPAIVWFSPVNIENE